MSVKFESTVKVFRGRKDENLETFWTKFEVVAEVNAWGGEEKARRVALFLDDDALLVYSRESADDRKDLEKIRKKLKSTFSISKAEAYQLFVEQKLRADEQVDAYSADLYRLANLAGYNAVDDTDAMVVEQFLRGLPREFARQVRLAMAGQQLKVSTCSARVNALRTTEREFSGQRHAVSAAARAEKPAGKNVMCFQCGELGHIRRTCPKKAGSGRQRQCFFCDGIGHVKKDLT